MALCFPLYKLFGLGKKVCLSHPSLEGMGTPWVRAQESRQHSVPLDTKPPPPPPQACGLSISQLEKRSPSLSYDLFMYFSITK